MRHGIANWVLLFLMASITGLGWQIYLKKECVHRSNADNEQEELLPTFPQGAVEFEFNRQADPATMQIPPGGAWKGLQHLIRERKISLNPRNKRSIAADADSSWQPINDFFSAMSITGLTTVRKLNPNIMYFCTGEGWFNADGVRGAGVWKSTDGGASWQQLSSTDNNNFYWCQDIAANPLLGHVYVATRNVGVQRSTDGGQTWQQVLGNSQGANVNRAADIEFTRLGEVFCTMGVFNTDGIYFSSSGDPGTFTKQTNGFPTQDITRIELATAPSNADIAYAVAVDNGPNDYHIKGFYRTTDKGSTWEKVTTPGKDSTEFARRQGWYDLIIEVAPHDPDVIVAGGLDLWKSTDGGDSWIRLSDGRTHDDTVMAPYVHVDQHEVTFHNKDTVYFSNDGGIWRSDNFTDSMPDIYPLNRTYNVTQFYATDIHPAMGSPVLVGGTQDNGSSMALDPGIAAFKDVSGADGGFCAIHPQHPDTFYTSKQYGRIYRFLDGPTGGYETIDAPYDNDSMLFINPFEMDPNNPEHLYIATEHGLLRLKNASTAPKKGAWTRACKDIGTISAIGIARDREDVVFLGRNVRSSFSGQNVKLFRVDNADTTSGFYDPVDVDPFNMLPRARLVNTSCVYVDPQDANHVIVTFSNYGLESIFESKNAMTDTATWELVEGDLPDIPVYWALLHPQNKEVCYIATELGVFYTKKLQGDSTTWLPSKSGMANVRTDMLRYRPADQTVVAATHGRGLFTGQLDTANGYEITWEERGPKNIGGRTRSIMIDPNDPSKRTIWAASVSGGLWKTTNIENIRPDTSSQDTSESPDSTAYNLGEYDLSLEVFPNPIPQSEVTLQYKVPYDGQIRLSIYDVTGQLVRQIFNEHQEKGEHKVVWNPSPDLEDGIYFAILEIGQQSVFVKLNYFESK